MSFKMTLTAAVAALALAACTHTAEAPAPMEATPAAAPAPAPAPMAAEPAAAPTKPDIVDTAVAAGSFKTLVAAVQAAGLVETLKGPGPFTVFAPTDEAFAALPPGTVDNLLKPENKAKLAAVLTYHVVPGAVKSGDLAGKTAMPKTVQGQTLAVDGMKGVTVNGAKVVSADIETSNGVIHVIDKVLLPK
jgi:uncharacterized surface protein with fasciclin (FAS1) repeats